MDIGKLAEAPVFLHLTKEKLQDFFDKTSYKMSEYGAGDLIVIQGHPCRSLYLLYSGEVRTTMSGPDGKQVTMEDLRAPVLLAPAFIFATNNSFPVNVVARTLCEVLLISKDAFVGLMCREPVVMHNFMRIISDRSYVLSRKINLFALYGLKSRVAQYLSEKGCIKNQQEVAERLGVARPSLSRVLAELAGEGGIAYDKRRVVIADRGKLEKYL